VLLAAASGATLEQTFQNNSVIANQTGFINNDATPVNATCNWWGDASGPSGAGSGTGNPAGPNVIFSPWATLSTYVAVNAGADQTIYTGYGPTNKTLTATATICGTPEYLWSTGAITPSITVSPTTTTTYTVLVTDANGHTASDGVTVFVQDARCGKKNEKVKLCHKGIGNQKFTMCVSLAEVSGHLGHGDVLGDCVAAAGKIVTSEAGNTITEAKINGEEKITTQTGLNVYPNPAKNILQLQWNSGLPGVQTIEVMDMQGHIILNQKFIQVKGSNYRQLSLLGFKSGIYLLKMSSGGQIKIVRLIVVK
jgi:hypothetical protein